MNNEAARSAESVILFPEVATEGVISFLDQAAQHLVNADGLREAADANLHTDLRGHVDNSNRRNRANELVGEALLITRVLDAVLPLPEDGTWQTEISRRRHLTEQEQAAPIQEQPS